MIKVKFLKFSYSILEINKMINGLCQQQEKFRVTLFTISVWVELKIKLTLKI